MLPMESGGDFAVGIENSRRAALHLFDLLASDPEELNVFAPELDIVIWAPKAAKASDISALTRQAFNDAANSNLHLAVASMPASLLRHYWPDVQFDQNEVACLRSCLMKPEHLEWVDRIWSIYKSVR